MSISSGFNNTLVMTSPYHAGELLVQQRLGERHLAERNGPAIRTTIAHSGALLMARQPLAIISSMGPNGQVWTSVLQGVPGFAHSPAPHHLVLDAKLLAVYAPDVLWTNLATHSAVSLLFIDFATRWRFRVNGHARAVAGGWVVDVEQAFLNCPQYIQPRPVVLPGTGTMSAVPRAAGLGLPAELAAWVSTADTFFVGSSDAHQALDTAFRGGPAGFVQVEAAGTLLVPDYAGNSMYNSLGNFEVNPAAGLLFLDAAGGRTVQFTGQAAVVWPGPDAEAPATPAGGPGRYWRFVPAAWVVAPLPIPLPFS